MTKKFGLKRRDQIFSSPKSKEIKQDLLRSIIKYKKQNSKIL